MIKKHIQYNLDDMQTPESSSVGERNFTSSPNVIRTEKNLNVKNFYEFNDQESVNRKGQKVARLGYSTLSGSVYSAAVQDYIIGITNLSYAASVGLPRPKDVGVGKTYIVKDEAGGATTTTITIRSAGEETIDGATTATITTNYGSKSLYSDGQYWFIY